MALQLTSTVFAPCGEAPLRHTCEGAQAELMGTYQKRQVACRHD